MPNRTGLWLICIWWEISGTIRSFVRMGLLGKMWPHDWMDEDPNSPSFYA